MKRLSLLICFVGFAIISQAQKAKIAGKITSVKNEALIGVSLTLKSDKTQIAKTDVEGRYSFTIDLNKKYTLTLSYVGYESKTVADISASNAGEEVLLDILLEESGARLTDVTVSATKTSNKGATDNALIAFQKNTNTVASVISAESIKRSPDRNTAEILKRTPGASIQEGKYIIVRGLADRYNQAMLNGILLTSTEADRKTFSFDLFPSQIIDNIIINKAFVPELPGEWAGGLIQVNTKDIPTKNFFNVQLGTSVNSLITGKDFFKDKGGKTDWLGLDDGSRALPSGYTTKSNFDTSSLAAKTALGKTMSNNWAPVLTTAKPNMNVQMNGGFSGTLWGKKIGGMIGVSYANSYRFQDNTNNQNGITDEKFNPITELKDNKYFQDINMGALAGLSIFLNPLNKISYKAIVNVKTSNVYNSRLGKDYTRQDLVKGNEFVFGQNIFFTNQLNGEHSLSQKLKFNWYGAFNILDAYTPDQRRIMYTKSFTGNDPYVLNISNTLSQQSGSRIFQTLSDYIYTGGGDLTLKVKQQTIKAGYMIQIKDRLYDAQLFAITMPVDNPALRLLPAESAFVSTNFGTGTDNKFAFNSIENRNFRYLANTILNAGFVQFDNKLSDGLRIVWGLRVENFDQLVGSVKKWDPRHTYSKVTDYLPGVNATIKLSQKANLRITGSQTVIRPELRELSALNIYDFELNASVSGNPSLKRTKITNTDLRYELYPAAGEMFTVGIFYKNFENPIESIFQEGAGGSSLFSFQNVSKATAFGFEIEGRKKLSKRFTLQANGSYINSKIDDAALNISRSLQGQSPYLINTGILYDVIEKGFNTTILFNQVGKRIYLVGDIQAGAGTPDVYENPRALIDFQVSKKFAKNKAEIKLTISDLLNQRQIFYQNNNANTDYNTTTDAIRLSRKYGTTYGVTINYSL
ncbi:MAG: outer membrane beta-barrel protein [Sediminibacterium sp.]|nr:outer membrane beta-barrel protein [Sediminibacterium sp.]